MTKQFNILRKDYKELEGHLIGIVKEIRKIRSLQKACLFDQVENYWGKIDKLLKKAEKNLFFKHIILPMNRVIFGLYLEKLPAIQFETDQNLKINTILPLLEKAVNDSLTDIKALEPTIKEFFELR